MGIVRGGVGARCADRPVRRTRLTRRSSVGRHHDDTDVLCTHLIRGRVYPRPRRSRPIAVHSGKRRQLNPLVEPDFVAERIEKMKASI